MRYKFLSMVLAGLLSTSFLSGDYVSIGDNVDSTKTDKGIKVEGIDDLKGNADYIEYAKALKESYRVNEPIKMKFRLKKDSYIYGSKYRFKWGWAHFNISQITIQADTRV